MKQLRKLATRFEFGEGLEEALRDRRVCGLKEELYLKRLFAEHELTLSKDLTAAQSLELADQIKASKHCLCCVNELLIRGSSELHAWRRC